ncbi:MULTISPECIES: DUF982 domain-containing protein [Rhizobium]|uniref:DUF982 domain-containing protein n=2 Tax=Rhizobium TaxID=379 RepID=A0A329YG59_RHITR|nr:MULTISPECIES: DUF982 domain-containing protein [Rhizobium]MBB3486082.1 hypothetical protein [Rhizobium sp. BK347]MBB3290909.1 hypothetical protein [Rhizobium sp. BK252]MBB3405689.1 hypothetical protein [Rhizobium sp. BK289]MBB3418236.1 hypothetical protein [Rhizobium sp. BK284]MDK4723842.1 DUF982 domain-containing protein [Rhizobium sp. CNPSo 3968]
MVMYGIWQRPVNILLQCVGELRAINSSSEALDCLLADWPVEEDQAYQDALIICRASVEGNSNPEIARDAFIVAAYEAHIYMKLGYIDRDFIAIKPSKPVF